MDTTLVEPHTPYFIKTKYDPIHSGKRRGAGEGSLAIGLHNVHYAHIFRVNMNTSLSAVNRHNYGKRGKFFLFYQLKLSF